MRQFGWLLCSVGFADFVRYAYDGTFNFRDDGRADR